MYNKILLFKSLIKLLVIALSFLCSDYILAQNTPFQDTISVDSAEAAHLGLFDEENRKTFKIMLSGEPARAGLYSLIFPGAGQIFNKKYWKAPIVWGVVGYFGYIAVKSNTEYRAMDKAYRCMLDGGSCSYTIINANKTKTIITDKKVMSSYWNTKKSSNERNWVTFSVIYLVQVLEAYIDRHLIDFDLNPNLTIKPSISPYFNGFGLTYNISQGQSHQKKLFTF